MADAPTLVAGNAYTFNLTGAGRGNVTIDVEDVIDFMDGRQRPLRVRGTVDVPPVAPTRDHTLLPLAVPDDDEWSSLKEMSYEGGHLVGLKYGGPDHETNLAPMSKGANSGSGTWGAIEKALAAECAARLVGQTVQIDVKLSYNDNTDSRIPSRVKGWIRRFTGVVQQAHVPIDIAVAAPVDLTNCLDVPLINLFNNIEQAAAATGYQSLVASPDAPNKPLDVVDYKTSGPLRAQIRAAHPLLASYPLSGVKKKPRQSVHRAQRLLMLFYNRFRNKRGSSRTAFLTAENMENLGLILEEWRAQHDHIRPKSKGGSNRYGNLILVHHRVNNRRGNRGVAQRGAYKRVVKKPKRYGG